MNNADFTVTSVPFAYYKEVANGHFINIKNRKHNGITLVLSGTLKQFFSDGSESTADAGDIIIQRRGDSYRLESVGDFGTEYIVISYTADREDELSSLLNTRVFRTGHFRRYRDSFSEAARIHLSSGICQAPLLRALVQEILCNIIIESQPYTLLTAKNPAAAAKYHIDEYFDRSISANDLEAVSGVCASHLRTVFKKAYGESPNRYLNRVRVERAKEMLASGMFTVSEVAESCGFLNVYYFNRVFKEYTGTTPGKY